MSQASHNKWDMPLSYEAVLGAEGETIWARYRNPPGIFHHLRADSKTMMVGTCEIMRPFPRGGLDHILLVVELSS